MEGVPATLRLALLASALCAVHGVHRTRVSALSDYRQMACPDMGSDCNHYGRRCHCCHDSVLAGEHHDPETVVVLESHPLMLDAVVAHLSGAGFKVAAGTPDHHAVVRLVEREQPALVIIGIDQVDPREQQFFTQLRAVRRGLKIIVYGTDVSRAVERSVRAGADAFVRKSAPVEDLVFALRQMTHRTIYFRDLVADAISNPETSISTTSVLTDREYEVIRLAASGLPRRAIAESLGLSIATVKLHLSNIYRKLGVANRAQAVRWFHFRP